MSDIKNSLTRVIGKGKLSLIKHSPEILLVTGIVTGGAAIVTAITRTLKADEVLDKHEENLEKIKDALELETKDYTEEDAKKDTVKAYTKTAWEFAKLYAPTIIFSAVSVTCILSSHGIMRKRNIALATSLAAVRGAFNEYRERVVRDLGSNMDEHFLYDTIEKGQEVEYVDEKGKTKTKTEKYVLPTKGNIYSRFFDEANPNWEKDGSSNYFFVRSQMLYLQKRLIRDGYLFLNDVYKQLGMPITVAGQSAGWIYDFNNRNNTMIFFEGFDENNLSDQVRAFMNGYERNCLINFENVMDDILTDLPRVNGEVEAV